MRRALVMLAAVAMVLTAAPTAVGTPVPPLRTSPNVALVGNVPGSYAGLVFSGKHAYATGWATGLTVLDISTPAAPRIVGALPLPHFENEDVEVCGKTVLVANDRAEEDLGGLLHVIDVADPTLPRLLASLPLGLTGSGRGAGHIANFVTADCSLVWVDGGDDVEVVSLKDRAKPRSLGSFRSWAATGPDPKKEPAFVVTHDTERDSTGLLWSVGGGGAAAYRLTKDPLKPTLVATTGKAGVNVDYDPKNSPYNDFILHNSQRMGDTLLVTEEDYIDTSEAQPGSCHGQGKFETWRIRPGAGGVTPLDTWQTELTGADTKAPLTINCSSHWFDQRGGIAAVGWYEQGVRFLDVRKPGDIRQVGYYLPADGSTWAAYWVPGAKDLVYTADPYRGIDVLRVGPSSTPVKAPILAEWFAPRALAYEPSAAFGWFCALPR